MSTIRNADLKKGSIVDYRINDCAAESRIIDRHSQRQFCVFTLTPYGNKVEIINVQSASFAFNFTCVHAAESAMCIV